MNEIDEYIIRELERGIEPERIVAGMAKAGYDENKIKLLVERYATSHSRRALFSHELLSIEHFLSWKFIAFVLTPALMIILVLLLFVFSLEETSASLIASLFTVLVTLAISSRTAEHFLEKMGFKQGFAMTAFIIMVFGVIIALLSLLLRLHPILIGLPLTPLFFLLAKREMGMHKAEAASLTLTVSVVSVIAGYAAISLFGVLAGVARALH
ncbi:MAG: hypothetical protein V1735_03730 [Nanoarchaeota archaeon]